MGKVISVNISEKKGVSKRPVESIELVPGLGVKGDAHSAPGNRQLSLLMIESIDRANESMGEKGCEAIGSEGKLLPGAYAENITTEGLDLLSVKLGDELHIGKISLRVSKIGKECPRPCSIYYKLGSCIMPKEGIFCEVITGGVVRPGDTIEKV